MATDLGQILRDEIRRQKISQNQIARDTDLAQTNLSRFMRGGDLYISTASILIDYLGLEVRRKNAGR